MKKEAIFVSSSHIVLSCSGIFKQILSLYSSVERNSFRMILKRRIFDGASLLLFESFRILTWSSSVLGVDISKDESLTIKCLMLETIMLLYSWEIASAWYAGKVRFIKSVLIPYCDRVHLRSAALYSKPIHPIHDMLHKDVFLRGYSCSLTLTSVSEAKTTLWALAIKAITWVVSESVRALWRVSQEVNRPSWDASMWA